MLGRSCGSGEVWAAVTARWRELVLGERERQAPLKVFTVHLAQPIPDTTSLREARLPLSLHSDASSAVFEDLPFVVRMISGNAEVTRRCAIELATVFGGLVHDERSSQIGERRVGTTDPSLRDLLSTWWSIHADIKMTRSSSPLDRRMDVEAKREWSEAASSDSSYETDNDWWDI